MFLSILPFFPRDYRGSAERRDAFNGEVVLPKFDKHKEKLSGICRKSVFFKGSTADLSSNCSIVKEGQKDKKRNGRPTLEEQKEEQRRTIAPT